ncbi:hypothetical protein MNBD_PLANCTO03-2463 [hydrothermal vent metagenome]|uniref:Transposase IS200-like domain-containing protein n=1 Tax=hydrothermal vent metagenome TaxID=652676 RepID=A0A3B1DUM8_9ZZZZ
MSRLSKPLAYFLTWTTYGTWLHGDPRGSVDDTHNLYGHPYLSNEPDRRLKAQNTLVETPFRMGDAARNIVKKAIIDHAAMREWRTLALSVQTNHVHLVILAAIHTPEQIMAQCKSWATRRLREAELLGVRKRVWTKMGSTRWLWNEKALLAAIDYTKRMQ